MRYLLIFLLTIAFHISYAQSPRQIFQSAQEAFEKGDNQTALRYLAQCESALGKSNPRIESLRAICYSNMGDWKNACIAATMYFRMAPPSNYGTPAHKDMEMLKQKAEAEIKAADERFQKDRDEQRMNEAVRFRQEQEREETVRTNARKKESESQLYAMYKNSTDPQQLEEYLKMFPNSSYKKDIDFKKYVAAGDQDMKAKRWTQAVNNYTKALELKNDATVRNKLRDARDEQGFAIAQQNGTVEAYQNYVYKYPSGLHKKEADRHLQVSYLKLARYYVAADDYNKAVAYYKTYQERYPQGPEIAAVNKELCNLHVAEAKKQEKTNTAAGIGRALELYGYAQQCGITTSQSHLNALKRKAKRWGRQDIGFFGWHADEKNLIGAMAGSLNNRKLGMYVSARTGIGFFETASDWETNNANSLEESTNTDKEFTGKIVPKDIHVNLGLTKKIAHPLYVFAGAGVTFGSELRQFRSFSGLYEEYVVNKDAKYTSFNPEGGIYLWLGPLVLRYGINKPLHEQFTSGLMHHFGAAVKF
jgi:hypothetical protein